ncbi:MAG TPA: NADH-quinone oxidoreductase subunit M [Myxococcales bacterium]|jgi:NADH-quinone oxidoreductase subunit M
MSWLDAHLLTLVIFLPVVGGVLVALLPRGEGGQHKGVALVFSVTTFVASLPLWIGFHGKLAFEQKSEWAPTLGFSYHIGLDGVALLLFMLTTFLGPIVVLSSWKFVQERVKEYCLAILLLETAMLGTLAALDLVLFYVFWEAMLIPMYLLIGMWGSERRIYAAVKFFLFTFVGSVLMLLAIFWLWSNSGPVGHRTFDYLELLQSGAIDHETQGWLFAAFCLAFAIKVPIWPLHTWLPDAHTEAPAAGSILLAGVMLKMGTFGFIRYAMPLFPQAALEHAPFIATLGVVGIVYGSLMCMAQTDLKRLIAYSSVAHLGFVMLGLSALTREAVSGAVLQMVNHGISTGALFLMIGYLYERTHTRDLAAYGGVATVAPAIAATFLVITLSSIGLPGTNGFVGEFLILIGTFTSHAVNHASLLSVVASTGVILGAVYMLWLYQRVFWGPARKAVQHGLPDLTVREWVTVAPLLVAIVWIGFQPQPLLNAIREPVDAFVERVVHPQDDARKRADALPPVDLMPRVVDAVQAAPAPQEAEGK